jgi:hypothetical protein
MRRSRNACRSQFTAEREDMIFPYGCAICLAARYAPSARKDTVGADRIRPPAFRRRSEGNRKLHSDCKKERAHEKARSLLLLKKIVLDKKTVFLITFSLRRIFFLITFFLIIFFLIKYNYIRRFFRKSFFYFSIFL